MTGITELIQNAIDDPEGNLGDQAGYRYVFDRGDLRQIAAQMEFLRKHGFQIGSVNAFPAVRTEEDLKKGLTLIWNNKVDGWWNYKDRFSRYGICSDADFNIALNGATGEPATYPRM